MSHAQPFASPPNSSESSTLARLLDGLDAIHRAQADNVGPADARRLEAHLRLSRLKAYRGRRWIREADDVDAWRRGVEQLTDHYVLEMANGHAATHGAVDHICGATRSDTYEWGNTVGTEDWRVDHNLVHHPHTNLVSRDPDFDLLFFRFSDRQRWRPRHLFQLPALLALPLTSSWLIPLIAAAGRAQHEGRDPRGWATWQPVLRRVLAELHVNYIAPLRHPRRMQVLLGHLVAKVVSDVIIGGALFASHHSEDALDLGDEPSGTRATAYLRQILSTVNFRLPNRAWENIHLRGVNYHIEHHLFPDLPVERLPEVSRQVEALCEELSIPHMTSTLPRMGLEIIRLAARFSLPVRRPTAKQAARRALYRSLIAEHQSSETRASPRPSARKIHAITLTRSGRQLAAREDEPLLSALERAGIDIPTGCRRGACQTCRTRKYAGRTSQDPRGTGDFVNVCIARPHSNVVLDA